jgi:hypothetical protein
VLWYRFQLNAKLNCTLTRKSDYTAQNIENYAFCDVDEKDIKKCTKNDTAVTKKVKNPIYQHVQNLG